MNRTSQCVLGYVSDFLTYRYIVPRLYYRCRWSADMLKHGNGYTVRLGKYFNPAPASVFVFLYVDSSGKCI